MKNLIKRALVVGALAISAVAATQATPASAEILIQEGCIEGTADQCTRWQICRIDTVAQTWECRVKRGGQDSLRYAEFQASGVY